MTLRPCNAHDTEFLFRVYASSREREMSAVIDWDSGQKEAFLRDQFRLQHHHYQTHYPNARYDVIERNGEAVGRFYVERMRNEIRIMDIALLPEHRGQGIGRALLEEVLEEATRVGKFVSLHVEDDNPAKRLYERMGFVVAGEVSFYKLMHWIPAGVSPRYEDGAASAAR
jgi:ribosomal protein S18 acetylase RimI-like enzyme